MMLWINLRCTFCSCCMNEKPVRSIAMRWRASCFCAQDGNKCPFVAFEILLFCRFLFLLSLLFYSLYFCHFWRFISPGMLRHVVVEMVSSCLRNVVPSPLGQSKKNEFFFVDSLEDWGSKLLRNVGKKLFLSQKTNLHQEHCENVQITRFFVLYSAQITQLQCVPFSKFPGRRLLHIACFLDRVAL